MEAEGGTDVWAHSNQSQYFLNGAFFLGNPYSFAFNLHVAPPHSQGLAYPCSSLEAHLFISHPLPKTSGHLNMIISPQETKMYGKKILLQCWNLWQMLLER